MGINPNMAEVAALLGERSRATILASMMDGRFHTASELAYMAAIKPQTASFHLAKLVEGKLIKVEKQGRHRYFQLAGEDIAQFLESFLVISPPPEVRSLKQSSQMKLLQDARTCYDHLAGKLGVQLTESMVDAGYLKLEDKQFILTDEGTLFFTTFGMDLAALKRKRRSFSPACLDWSERRYHLAGALGNGLLNQLLNLGWLTRVPSIRAIKVTEKGKRGFKEVFHLDS
ncbi:MULTISPECIES: ArsR/SmtB family transcription factor [Lysinibacillus]|jgi:DNA-binding transcriptional ArsR family regulator|uniref:ArsR family transcriptional regulator n=1 Tax=Lysinibacillus fusiformis TaxID=28031 RepID=A0A2I0V0A0_9BACI|nr:MULTISPECIES: winged helix-turn-helix domain-containing protein [Lysinibacillus]MEE3806266.1 winged helix-turn-helix domain-containing protein [Lysinibacillus fusiformis]PKU51715.1 ArsR family transcriptional regulator [Lysinibacillus fusiformis]WCH45993.1 winged helix-turn-helix domain-containing protein [Lysinibacillus sp. OF-1]SCY31926.1 transcriptional regulator, ArsR family [Lysinibacillus sp. SG9]SDB16934.1 transcriptional regulator, ArsR family [Lysinibacillus sp. TC-37]